MVLLILFPGTYIFWLTFQPLCKRPCSLVSEFTGWCALFVALIHIMDLPGTKNNLFSITQYFFIYSGSQNLCRYVAVCWLIGSHTLHKYQTCYSILTLNYSFSLGQIVSYRKRHKNFLNDKLNSAFSNLELHLMLIAEGTCLP